jgi:Domain of unknown function (DUF4926)
MINELDQVALTRDVPSEQLKAGDVGTVVMVHENGKGFTVEFMTFSGDTIGVVTLDAKDVRPISAREIVHARAVA